MDATNSDQPPALPLPGRGHVLLTGAVILGLAVGAGLLIAKAAGSGRVWVALSEVAPGWLVVCFACEAVSYLAYGAVLRDVVALDAGPRLAPVTAVRTVFASLGATRLVAAAGAGGLAVVYWVLRRLGFGARAATARVLALNILVFGVFGVLGLSAGAMALAVPWVAPDHPWVMAISWVLAMPLCFLGAGLVSHPRRAGRLADRGPGRIGRAIAGVVDGLALARRVALRPDRHARLGVGCLVYWAGDIACLWAALASVGRTLTPVEVVLAYATGYVAMLAPLPTGGFGAVDAAVTFALVPVGVPLATAVAGVTVWRFFSFWLPTVPALVALARIRSLGGVSPSPAPLAGG